MTRFEPVPSSETYKMHTEAAADTAMTLQSIRDFSGYSVTEAVRRVLACHKLFEDTRAMGGLLLADAGQLEVLAPPVEELRTSDQKYARVNIQVNLASKDYLAPRTNEEDDHDLVNFWHSAVSFYSRLNERQTLGQRFWQVRPGANLKIERYVFFFDSDAPQPKRRRWHGGA